MARDASDWAAAHRRYADPARVAASGNIRERSRSRRVVSENRSDDNASFRSATKPAEALFVNQRSEVRPRQATRLA